MGRVQVLLAIVVLALLGLHTAQPYFQTEGNRSPLLDQWSVVLLGLLIAVAVLPKIESLKVWIFEFRTSKDVAKTTHGIERTFETDAARQAASSAARQAATRRSRVDPRTIIREAQRDLETAMRALAAGRGIEQNSGSLSQIALELKEHGVIDDNTLSAATSLARDMAKALGGGVVRLSLASEIEYAAELLGHSLTAREQ